MNKYKKLQEQVSELANRITLVERNNKQLAERVLELVLKDFNDQYPNGQIKCCHGYEYGESFIDIKLIFSTDKELKRHRVTKAYIKLTSYKLKQTDSAYYIGLKFEEREEFYVLSKATGNCIKLDDVSLQDAEWIDYS